MLIKFLQGRRIILPRPGVLWVKGGDDMELPQDPSSPEAVIGRYSNMIYRLAFARMGNVSDAEDLYQEVFLRYLTRAPAFTSEEHRKAWLLRVAVNCANRFHTALGRRRTEPLSEALSVPAPEAEGLWEELRRLPERDRTILHLYYYEDMTTEEIAALLERNPATVRSQLLRARGKLKKLLTEEGVDHA